jgi:hypothetical protein
MEVYKGSGAKFHTFDTEKGSKICTITHRILTQAFVVTFDTAKLKGGTMYNVPWNY